MNALRHTRSFALVLASVLGSAQAAESASATEWQLALLFNPSEQQIKVEEKGRVVIYDGLKSAEVEKAMEQEFERIEHMMFIRTKVPSDTGGYVEADDGC
jgi:hypothetical protein